jgi:hypothetical protein
MVGVDARGLATVFGAVILQAVAAPVEAALGGGREFAGNRAGRLVTTLSMSYLATLFCTAA